MFNIGASELIVILLIAFIVVGPKDLPKVARSLGRAVKRLRGIIEEVKRETGLDEVEAEIKNVERDIGKTDVAIKKEIRELDPTADIKKVELDTAKELRELKKDIDFSALKKDIGGKSA